MIFVYRSVMRIAKSGSLRPTGFRVMVPSPPKQITRGEIERVALIVTVSTSYVRGLPVVPSLHAHGRAARYYCSDHIEPLPTFVLERVDT